MHRRNARPETDGKSLRGPRLPSFSYSPFAESREQRNLTRDFILWIRFFVVVFKTMRNKYFSEKNDVKMVKIDVIAICFSGWRDNPKWDYMINYSLAYALFYTEPLHYEYYIRNTNPKIKNLFKWSGTQNWMQKYALITML